MAVLDIIFKKQEETYVKSLLVTLLTLIIFFSAISLSSATDTGAINVEINGTQVAFPDARPYINEDSRTMVPVRFIAEGLGAKVEWDEIKRIVTMILSGKNIILGIGNSYAHVNSVKTDFDTAAEIVQDRVMVPLRFIFETFEADVKWDKESKTVSITTKPATPAPKSLITLFFSNDQARGLVAETRTVGGATPTPEQVFEELLKGPQTPGLKPTIPVRTQLLSAFTEVDRKIVYINLSSHFVSDHPRTPATEKMTIYSIVNSMAQLPEIDRVMFMLEGKPTDSILGSLDTSAPLEPDM